MDWQDLHRSIADAMIEERRKRMPTPGEYELIAVTPHKGQPR